MNNESEIEISADFDNSPISCGSSWHRTATLVDTPLQGPEAKATPMAIPSARLWIPSPRMTCDWSMVRMLLSDWSLTIQATLAIVQGAECT